MNGPGEFAEVYSADCPWECSDRVRPELLVIWRVVEAFGAQCWHGLVRRSGLLGRVGDPPRVPLRSRRFSMRSFLPVALLARASMRLGKESTDAVGRPGLAQSASGKIAQMLGQKVQGLSSRDQCVLMRLLLSRVPRMRIGRSLVGCFWRWLYGGRAGGGPPGRRPVDDQGPRAEHLRLRELGLWSHRLAGRPRRRASQCGKTIV